MRDPLDDMIRSASAPDRPSRPAPPARNKTALALLLGIAALLLGLPVYLALTGDTTDLLLGLATGDPSVLTIGDR